VSLPAPPDEIRAAVTAAAGLSLLHAALAAKRDVASVVATLLARDDENIRRGVFYALAMSSTPLPDATVHLASPLARVRYYAADHYGELSTHFTGRAAELEALLHDADASVVGAAAWALGRLGDRRAAAWLTPLLGSSEEWVRVTAANALLALGAGANEIADAIRAGAGELTFCILMAKWPSLTPSLREAAPADLVERLAAGVHLDALLRELSFAASAELLVEHGATELRATLPPTVNRTQVLSACVLARRWAITFDGTTLTLTTHGAAADFWAKALAEN